MAIPGISGAEQKLKVKDDNPTIQQPDTTSEELQKGLTGDGNKEVPGEIKYKEPTDEELLREELPEVTVGRDPKDSLGKKLLQAAIPGFQYVTMFYELKTAVNMIGNTHTEKHQDGTKTKSQPLLDEKGNLIGKRETDKNSFNKPVSIRDYDKDNNLITETKFEYYESGRQLESIEKYDGNKQLIYKETYRQNGKISASYTYEDGGLAEKNQYDEKGNLTKKYIYKYEPAKEEDLNNEDGFRKIVINNNKNFFIKVTETNLQTDVVKTYYEEE